MKPLRSFLDCARRRTAPAAMLLVLALVTRAQQPPKPPTLAGGGFKISVDTNLVVVNVDVRDRDGKPVEGLKASDFSVFEDEKLQRVSIFEFQRLEAEPLPPPPAPELKTRDAPPAAILATRNITPSTPGQIRFKDRRLIVFFFDFSSMPVQDQLRAQAAALEFLEKNTTAADVVSLMAYTQKLQVLEDFTSDRERLRELIKAFRIGEMSELSGDILSEDEAEDDGSAFTADETEFNVFNTDRKLSALENAAKMLASLPEKKALVYFSSGVGKTGMENQSQLRSTINAAVRANVAFYPVDARGLVATAPAGDATRRSPSGSGVFSGRAQTQMRARFNDQQETLVTLAGDTGGKAMLDTNDLASGIRQAQKDISSYYILGYYSSNSAQDGRFRKIRVKLNGTLQAKLSFRDGYYAGKEFKNFNRSDNERQLEEAILLGDPMTELPLALEVNYFRLGRAAYFVPLAVKIPGSAMEMVKKSNSQRAELDFIAQVRDSRGRLAGTVRDGIQVKLDEENAARLTNRNLQYDSGFILPPGQYKIKFLARENVTGKMGTFETAFAVPDLLAESPYLPTSSVVWSNQREPLASAVGSAGAGRRTSAAHPLVQGGHKLVPSITRVYRRNQNLYVYLEAYKPLTAEGPQQPEPDILASISFFSGDVKAFQTSPVRVGAALSRRPGTVPIQFEVPLADLKPGSYTCQVNLVDEAGRKFAFSRAPMVLLP